MSRNAMVAVCDVLGFGDYVKSNSLDDAISYLRSIQDLAEKSKLTAYTPEGDLRSYVGHANFSDTVVFYSLKDHIRAFEHIIIAVFRILAIPIFDPKFHPYSRFRIGISYGEVCFDNREQIYVGKALVHAYELERKQEWCGAVLSQAAFDQVKRLPIAEIFLKKI